MNFIDNFQKQFPFKLDQFQLKGIQKIYNEESVLITAHTGSGKTLLANFAIQLAKSKGKKVIYTSPIKSLSNQKFHEFTQKYKDISIGILTGDIKYNPDAECLIMTTEILRNLLYKQNSISDIAEKKLDINIDMKDVDSVIFDEIHYINDKDRGKVWEESIILLPKNIKLVMLSATIDRAQEFASWIENIKQKKVNLISNEKRVIPLTHSVYYFTKYPKKHKKTLTLFNNETYLKRISKQSNKRLTNIYQSDGEFDNNNYNEIVNLINFEKRNNKWYSDVEVLNSMCMFLQRKKKLPALFFIFSRKRCEEYAKKIQYCFNNKSEQNLVENIINDQIKKLGNPDIYINNPKLYELKKILIKGIAIHHSGLLPVYKEIIEILYGQGLIKVLLATETFAVGVNMPTKTIIFTSLEKYTKEGRRMLYAHEYAQMAGRAGRRGLDKRGDVMILSNMFRNLPSCHQINTIIAGKSQYIESKFNFNYQFLLKAILANDINLGEFINQTLLKKDIQQDLLNKQQRLQQILEEVKNIQFSIDIKSFEQYYELNELNNKKQMKQFHKMKNFKKEYQIYLDTYDLFQEKYWLEETIPIIKNNMEKDQMKSIQYLIDHKYIKNQDIKQLNTDSLTMKGIVASQINECNEIVFTECLLNGIFDNLNTIELASILGVFCDSKLAEEDKRGNINNLVIPDKIKEKLFKIKTIMNTFEEDERKRGIQLSNEWDMNLDMVEYTYLWASGKSFSEIGFMNFEGNFIRDMIRIDNIAKDLIIMGEVTGNLNVMNTASFINEKIIRDIVTIDSLYVRF